MTFSKKKKNSLNARPKVDRVRYGKVHMFKHLKRTYVHTFAHENDSKRTLKKLVTLVATFCCSLLLLFWRQFHVAQAILRVAK